MYRVRICLGCASLGRTAVAEFVGKEGEERAVQGNGFSLSGRLAVPSPFGRNILLRLRKAMSESSLAEERRGLEFESSRCGPVREQEGSGMCTKTQTIKALSSGSRLSRLV